MEYASPVERELFWRRYNESRRRSARKAVQVGELLGPWLKKESASIGSGLSAATQLWSRVAPSELRGRYRVEALLRKTLRLTVDGKSTAFALQRRVEAAFLKLVRTELAGIEIERVTYRVGRIPRDA